MSTAGEAASLFGSADSAADPFSSVLGGDTGDTVGQVGSDSVSQLFASEGLGSSSSAYDAWNNTDTGHGNYEYYTNPTQEHVGAVPTYQSGPAQVDQYTGYGQPAYSTYAQSYPTSSGLNNSYAQAAPTDIRQMHDPYAPTYAQTIQDASSYVTNPSAYTPGAPATDSTYTNPATAPYDPYRPAPASSAVPQFSVVPPTPQAYDAYNPAAQPSYVPTPQSTVLHAPGNSLVQPPKSPSIPAPTAASTSSSAPYRPKVLNAYDPPLPPPKRHAHVTPHLRSPPPLHQPLHLPSRAVSPPKRPQASSSASPSNLYNSTGSNVPYNGTQPPSAMPSPYNQPSYDTGSSMTDPYAPHRHSSSAYNGAQHSSAHHADEAHAPGHGLSSVPSAQNGPIYRDVSMMPPPPARIPTIPPSTSSRASSPSDGLGLSMPPVSVGTTVTQGTQAISLHQSDSWANGQASYIPAHPEATAPVTSPDKVSIPHHDPYAPAQQPSMDRSPRSSIDASETAHDTGLSAASLDSYDEAHSKQGSPPLSVVAERARSPGTSSVRSWTSVSSLDVPAKAPLSPPPRELSQTSPPPTVKRAASPLVNRTSSPSASSVRSFNGIYTSFADPYTPLRRDSTAQEHSSSHPPHDSAHASASRDPYEPSGHTRHPSDKSNYSSYSIPFPENSASSRRSTLSRDASTTYIAELTVPPQTMYAPSPSLLGTNDPLGRASARVPVISFGFGGKVVTCFHGSSCAGGFDVALSTKGSTDVQLLTLGHLVPASVLNSSTADYPGPLFADPGPPAATLVRPTAATQMKMKKASLMKYLEERAQEISRGLGYLNLDSMDGRKSEAKLSLINLLKVMVENDGRLSGTPEIDTAVRAALVPAVVAAPASVETAALASALELRTPFSDGVATSYPGFGSSLQDMNDPAVAVQTVRSSDLDKIQEMLIRGDRRAAYQYASERRLWTHAMVIASSIDKEAWKEVVKDFVRVDLASKITGSNEGSSAAGRESLRVAYSYFAGQGSASVQELLPPQPLAPPMPSLQVPIPSAVPSPISPSFSTSAEPMTLPFGVLCKWAETAAMIISYPMSTESSATLTALGDQLAANQWYEAAHACYILSPQTAALGGMGSGSRYALVGSPGPQVSATFLHDPDPIIFTEIVEFALSLATPVKGKEAFTGLTHLQPFRLVRAMTLAEMGHVQLARRYCEAISQCLSKSSPYSHPTFVSQLDGLLSRLVAGPQSEKATSWIGTNPPNLSKVSGWLGNRLAEFVAGEGAEVVKPQTTNELPDESAPSGPFAHYSTISSATNSAISSPQQSRLDLREIAGSPPLRTGSALGERYPAQPPYMAPNRASSAMGYPNSAARTASPIQRVASANAPRSSDYPAYSPYGQVHNDYGGARSSIDVPRSETEPTASYELPGSSSHNAGGWWGSQEADAPTPTASSFSHDNDAQSSHFVSLIDDAANPYTPTASQQEALFERQQSQHSYVDEEDDLGLGNNSSRAKRMTEAEGPKEGDTSKDEKVEPKKAEEPQKPELKSAASGSWLTRLWKRDSTPTPVKANLGEEKSFYYDENLKRWVNKNAPPEETKSAPPPPPPRAQTASPGRSNPAFPSGTTPPPPPPTRPATAGAIDLGGQLPPRRAPPPRVRSNLVPTDSDSSLPPTPISAASPLSDGPPMGTGRPKAKRTVRSRYVDVFQQQAES